MTAPATTVTPQPKPIFQAVHANEWGQITGLEPGASYIVIRRPTKELTRDKSQQFMADAIAFLHQQKELTERQVKELNEKYGTTAKAKAAEVRETLERRFDALTREFESRVEKLESELGERADRLFQKAKPADAAPAPQGPAPAGETPGEMPTGEEHPPATPAPEPAGDAKNAGSKKKGARKE